MRKIALVFILFVVVLPIFSCSKQISDTVYNDLIINLEKMDFTIIAEDVEKDILLGQRKWLTINENENISVYLYESSEKMEEDASYIDEGTMVSMLLKLVGSHTHIFSKWTILLFSMLERI